MISFLSPSSSFNASMEIVPEQSEEIGYPTLTPVGKANKGKTGLLSRGKHSIGKIINKAARMSGFKQNPEPKIGKEVVNHPELVAPVLELEEPEEINPLDNLPVMSEPSVLLSEIMRSVLYSSLPIFAQGRSWVLLYRFRISASLTCYDHPYRLLSNVYIYNFAAHGGMEYLYLLYIEGVSYALVSHSW